VDGRCPGPRSCRHGPCRSAPATICAKTSSPAGATATASQCAQHDLPANPAAASVLASPWNGFATAAALRCDYWCPTGCSAWPGEKERLPDGRYTPRSCLGAAGSGARAHACRRSRAACSFAAAGGTQQRSGSTSAAAQTTGGLGNWGLDSDSLRGCQPACLLPSCLLITVIPVGLLLVRVWCIREGDCR
jgi:hypothetical protein